MKINNDLNIKSFNPERALLMGAAPTNKHPRVREAINRPTATHVGKPFLNMMRETTELCQYIFQTENPFTLPLPTCGSGAMEFAIQNLVEPGDKVAICHNGYYSERMEEMARFCGAEVILIQHPWGEAIDPVRVEETLSAYPDIQLVGMIHGESSTGVLSDVESICRIAKKYNCLTVVDIVATVITMPVFVDEWQIDAAYCNSQKAVSAYAGVSPFTFSEEALRKIDRRKTPPHSWFFNATYLKNSWYKDPHHERIYPHTAPVNLLYALHEALLMIYEEKLENVHKRHEIVGEKLRNGLIKLGVPYSIPHDLAIPCLNVFENTPEFKRAQLKERLMSEHDIYVSDGLGKWLKKVLRISAMGYDAQEDRVDTLLKAVSNILGK